jgi:hypothetical protein
MRSLSEGQTAVFLNDVEPKAFIYSPQMVLNRSCVGQASLRKNQRGRKLQLGLNGPGIFTRTLSLFNTIKVRIDRDFQELLFP